MRYFTEEEKLYDELERFIDKEGGKDIERIEETRKKLRELRKKDWSFV